MAELVKLGTQLDMLFTPSAGYITKTLSTDEQGNIVLLVKKSDGTFTYIGSSNNVTSQMLGYVAVLLQGVLKLQKLQFTGTTASPLGDSQDMGDIGIFPTGMLLPEYGLLISTGSSMNFYKCASVNTSDSTWSGNKAIQALDGTWDFESAVTSDLSYSKGLTPVVGEVYNQDATIRVRLYSKVSILSKASFYASLEENMDNAQTGQVLTSYNSPEFIEYEGKKCCAFYESQYFTANTEGILTNQSPRTYSVEVYRGGSVHMKYIMSHGSDSGYCFRCYTTNNGVSIFGGGLDSNVSEHPSETWTRLTIVYTGTQWKVYFGTTLKMTVDLTVSEEAPETELLSIGSHLDGGGAYDGYMRNFTVFPFALTESEIAELQTAFA